MATKMQFNCVNVKSHLQRLGLVFTVRGYDMKDKLVYVEDVGLCNRTKIKEVTRITDLSDFVSRSGFLTAFGWWLQIDRFTADEKKFLYRVQKIEEEQATGLIENTILDSYKREGGIYKQAAEAVEADLVLEQEELDVIECPVSQSRVNKVCDTCGCADCESNRVIDGMCGLCLTCLLREEEGNR
jgi:hypothetical protein